MGLCVLSRPSLITQNTTFVLQSLISGSMRPITIVKRFLKGETPSIPLPPGIDHEVASNPSTAWWLLISQSSTRQQSNQIISTKEAECQTLSASQPFYSRPQACIKRSWGLSGDTPLPAPSFLPKSKAPKLDYEGLQPPKLHCLATSLLSNPLSPLQQTAPFLKPTPKSLPSPTSFRNTYCITVNDFSEPERARSQPHDIFSKPISPPNSFVKFTSQNFWVNALTASRTAWVQEALWPTCKSGIIGPAGANAISKYQLKHHFHSYWIISMLQITWKDEKIPNHGEPSKLCVGWHSNWTYHWIWLFKAKLSPIFLNPDPNSIWWSNANPTCCPGSLGAENSMSAIIVVGGRHTGPFLDCHNGITPLQGLTEKQAWLLSIQGHILRGISWTVPWSITNWYWQKSRTLGPQLVPWFRTPFMGWLSPFFITTFLSPCTCSYQILLPMQLAFTSLTHTRAGLQSLYSEYEINLTCCSRAAVPNRDIAKNQCNFTQEMMCGQVCSFNKIPWLISVRDGGHLQGRHVELNNHSRNHLLDSPPISQEGLQLVQMLQPKSSPATPARTKKNISPTPVEDSDEQGEDGSSSSSSSDSSNSSDQECATPTTSSIVVMNEKSHVVHAVRLTKSECSKRSSFSNKGKTFEVLCGSSVLGAPMQMIAEIPHGAKICQRKACLASIDHFLKWSFCVFTSVAHRVAFYSLRCEKKGFLHFIPMVFCTFLRWFRPRGACAQKNWANPFHHGCVLQNSFPVQYRSYTTPRHLILLSMCYWIMQSPQSLTGGFLPIALTRLTFAILAVFGGVSTQNLFLHNEWTKASLNLQQMTNSAVPPKLRYAPSVRIASQSMMC